MIVLFLALLFCHFDKNLVTGKGGMVTESRLEKTYQCPKHPNTTIVLKDVAARRINNREMRLFGDMIFQEDVEDIKVKMVLSKCASKSAPDTCEYYTSLSYASMCTAVKQKIEPWFGYFNGSDMPLHCPPFVKGNWKLKGVKVGLTSAFPLFNGFWVLQSKGYDPKNKLISCFKTELTIHNHFKLF